MRYVHLTLGAVWALLLIPTLLVWKDSVLWVAGMSLYANVVGHWSAFQASELDAIQARVMSRVR